MDVLLKESEALSLPCFDLIPAGEGVDSAVRNQYLKYFNPELPLCMEQPPFARIGGWHVLWPDDHFYTPREMRLMVWTFQDSEPWYEVFLSPLRNYIIKSRIT